MKRFHSICLLLLCKCVDLFAQDPRFSLFNEAPALLNPALTGANHPLRASVQYKEQWRGAVRPFQTYGLSFETRFGPSTWEQVDKHRGMTFKEKSLRRLAAGISIYSAREAGGSLNSTWINLSLAWFVPLNKYHSLSAGLQTSLVQRKADNSSFLFPNQYGAGGYDQSLPSGEKFNNLYYVYPDLSLGAMWAFNREEKRIGSNNRVKANAGFAVYHVAQGAGNFLNSSAMRYKRWVGHASALLPTGTSRLAIMPSFQWQMQGRAQNITAGFLLKQYYRYNSKYTGLVRRSSVNYGLYISPRDAVTAVFMVEMGEQYSIGLSYDITVSSLAGVVKSRGGLECVFRYTPPRGFLYEEKTLPE